MNNNTRRYPRTLQEAFGPYACGPVHPMPEPPRRFWQDVALYVVALLGVLAIVHWWAK